MKVTPEEMRANGINENQQDFCAHLLIKFNTCIRDNRPWYTNCIHEKHDWHHCQRDE